MPVADREIVIICGPMFSGKTTALITRIKKAIYAGHQVLYINPTTNTRDEDVTSRDGWSAKCQHVKIPPDRPNEIMNYARSADVVFIDEAQFFCPDIACVVQKLYGEEKRVVIACLDTDMLGNPFGASPYLLSIPEANLIRRHSVCEKCRRENATRTDLKDKNLRAEFKSGKNPILPGDANLYQALCYDCFRKANPDDYNNQKQEDEKLQETHA